MPYLLGWKDQYFGRIVSDSAVLVGWKSGFGRETGGMEGGLWMAWMGCVGARVGDAVEEEWRWSSGGAGD